MKQRRICGERQDQELVDFSSDLKFHTEEGFDVSNRMRQVKITHLRRGAPGLFQEELQTCD